MLKLRKILQIKCICLNEKLSFLVVTTITLIYNAEIEHVGQTHLQLAQIMRDEAKKLEDFRERQKDTKKKVRALWTRWNIQPCGDHESAIIAQSGSGNFGSYSICIMTQKRNNSKTHIRQNSTSLVCPKNANKKIESGHVTKQNAFNCRSNSRWILSTNRKSCNSGKP